jgi:molecular chaperone GrpE
MTQENSGQQEQRVPEDEAKKIFEEEFGQSDVHGEEIKLKENEEDGAQSENPFKEKFYYLAAEFENAKKRFEREKQNIIKYGSEQILRDLLGPIDLFELTVSALVSDTDPKIKNLVVGLEMIRKQMLDGLTKHGLQKIDSLNKEFDPNFHEAVSQETIEGSKPNLVVKELQSGFLLNGRLLRASRVVVSA